MQNHLSARLLAEFIGTFAFVFIGAGAAAVVGTGAGLNGIAAIAFAHGLTIMVFAFAYGNLSGAHFNPAVTVGVLAARAMSLGEAIGYIISQLLAAACAAFLLRAVLGGVATGLGRPELAQNVVLGATTLTITPAAGFVIEAVLAFFLVIVVLTTAVRPQRRQSRAYRYRNDRGSQHHDGWQLDRRKLQPCHLVGSDDRDCQLHQCLAVCNRSDRRRSCRGLYPQSNENACRGRDQRGGAGHSPGGMISLKASCVDEAGGDMLLHIALKLGSDADQNPVSPEVGMTLEEE